MKTSTRNVKRLTLKSQTIRNLSKKELETVAGGMTTHGPSGGKKCESDGC